MIAVQAKASDDNHMLTEKQKKLLRGLAHSKKPVVMVGSSGLSENVFAALEEALLRHELIKVKVSVGDRDERNQAIDQMKEQSKAELIQRIGNIAVFFRRNAQNPVVNLKA